MQIKGKITKWNDDRGFGFITPIIGTKQVFVHIKSFKNRKIRPELNQNVLYNISEDKNGKLSAIDVLRVGEKRKEKSINKTDNSNSKIIFLGFFISIITILFSLKVTIWFLLFTIIINILTYYTYKSDKVSAQKGEWRTPESTLHLLSLLGGWYGAIIAQDRLRHKSKKISFRIVFYITFILNITALIYFANELKG